MMRAATAANQMLVRLSDLLRQSLESVGKQEVPLWQELEFLNGYLEIEQTRFQDRLSIKRRIDPATLDAAVPNLILQPLVENAIRHGIARRPGAGHVEIRSQRTDSRLQIEIEDDGPGLVGEKSTSKGVGLTNTRARLTQLYGAAHQFEMRNAEGGGVLVRLEIPFHAYEIAP